MHLHAARGKFSLAFLVCCLILASSAIYGQESPQAAEKRTSSLDFTVTSIRPADSHATGWRMEFTINGFVAENVPLQMMVMEVYDAYMPGLLRAAQRGSERITLTSEPNKTLKTFQGMRTLPLRRLRHRGAHRKQQCLDRAIEQR